MGSNRELNIIIKADGSIAVTELKKLDDVVDNLGKEANDTGKKLDNTDKSIKKLGEDASTAGKKLDNTDKSIKKVGSSSKTTSKEIKMFGTSWAGLATGVNQALDIMSKGKQMIASGWDLAKQGAKFAEAKESFDVYAQSVGKSSQDIISKLKVASGGTIGEMDLVITASKAMSLGVTKDADKMASLLQIARNKARLFGIETTQAFEDIVTGVGRGSPLILDNLGIRIPAGFAKMTESMTDAEKTAKLLELTLIEGNKQLKSMGGISNNAADNMRVFETSVSNLKIELGAVVVDALIPTVKMINNELLPALQDAIDYWNKWTGIASRSKKTFKEQGAAGLIAEKQTLISELKEQKKELESIFFESYEGFDSYDQQRHGLNIAGDINASSKDIRSSISDKTQAITLQIKQLNKEILTTKENFFSEKESEFANNLLDDLKKLTIAEKSYGEEVSNTNSMNTEMSDVFGEFNDIFKETEEALSDISGGMEEFYDEVGGGVEELIEANDETQRLKEAWEDLNGAIQGVFTGFDFTKAQKSLTPDKAISGMMSMFGAGDYINATGSNLDFDSDDKDELSNIISDAITQGFANADFTDFTKTLGSILTNVASKSVSSKFPVIGSSGSINWGNLGINTAVDAGLNWLSSDGRPFGSYVEHGEESIQQAANLRTNTTNEYLKTFQTELLPYLNQAILQGISESRNSINGIQAYSDKQTSGDFGMTGLFAKNTNTYTLIDNGASASFAELAKWNEIGEDENKIQTHINELLEARGYSYDALVRKAEAYNTTVENTWSKADEISFGWDNGEGDTIDLTDEKYALYKTNEELKRQLGLANASRTSFANQAFTSYSPWLDTVPVVYDYDGDGVQDDLTYPRDTNTLSTGRIYDGMFESSMNYQDRIASPYMLDMIKQAGSGQFDLASLQLTDTDAYYEKYGEFLEKQIDAYSEVMEREENIYNDLTKTFEERSAALQEFEASQEAYYQAKLDQIAEEQRKEAELQQKQDEASAAKISSALSLVGEISQRNGNVLIIQGNDTTAAIDEMMTRFADDPEVLAVLKKSKELTDSQATWGKR